jgi:hypothetical protein
MRKVCSPQNTFENTFGCDMKVSLPILHRKLGNDTFRILVTRALETPFCVCQPVNHGLANVRRNEISKINERISRRQNLDFQNGSEGVGVEQVVCKIACERGKHKASAHNSGGRQWKLAKAADFCENVHSPYLPIIE